MGLSFVRFLASIGVIFRQLFIRVFTKSDLESYESVEEGNYNYLINSFIGVVLFLIFGLLINYFC